MDFFLMAEMEASETWLSRGGTGSIADRLVIRLGVFDCRTRLLHRLT